MTRGGGGATVLTIAAVTMAASKKPSPAPRPRKQPAARSAHIVATQSARVAAETMSGCEYLIPKP